MKIQIEGTQGECAAFTESLKCIAALKKISRWYPSKDFPGRGRVYIELQEG